MSPSYAVLPHGRPLVQSSDGARNDPIREGETLRGGLAGADAGGGRALRSIERRAGEDLPQARRPDAASRVLGAQGRGPRTSEASTAGPEGGPADGDHKGTLRGPEHPCSSA